MTETVTDSQLFARMAKRQVSALSVLYDRYSERLFGLAVKILQDRNLAEDVTQELFIYLWENSNKFDPERGDAGPWLMVLCRNRCIDKLRAKLSMAKRSTTISEEILQGSAAGQSDDAMAMVQHREIEERVGRALAQLPEPQRVAIELAYFEGLSQSEIAQNLKVPLGTVKTRVRTGMQKLRSLMSVG